MITFLFVAVSFLAGWIAQFVLSRLLAVFGVFPGVLMLLTLSFGALRGALLAETVGFFWGLTADVIGVTLFGAQGFMLALIGYLSGVFRNKVDMDYPQIQIIVGAAGSIIYFMGSFMIHALFGGDINFSLTSIIMWIILNALASPLVYACARKWLYIWGR